MITIAVPDRGQFFIARSSDQIEESEVY